MYVNRMLIYSIYLVCLTGIFSVIQFFIDFNAAVQQSFLNSKIINEMDQCCALLNAIILCLKSFENNIVMINVLI